MCRSVRVCKKLISIKIHMIADNINKVKAKFALHFDSEVHNIAFLVETEELKSSFCCLCRILLPPHCNKLWHLLWAETKLWVYQYQSLEKPCNVYVDLPIKHSTKAQNPPELPVDLGWHFSQIIFNFPYLNCPGVDALSNCELLPSHCKKNRRRWLTHGQSLVHVLTSLHWRDLKKEQGKKQSIQLETTQLT